MVAGYSDEQYEFCMQLREMGLHLRDIPGDGYVRNYVLFFNTTVEMLSLRYMLGNICTLVRKKIVEMPLPCLTLYEV